MVKRRQYWIDVVSRNDEILINYSNTKKIMCVILYHFILIIKSEKNLSYSFSLASQGRDEIDKFCIISTESKNRLSSYSITLISPNFAKPIKTCNASKNLGRSSCPLSWSIQEKISLFWRSPLYF